jgi:membrane-bound lytic murein transglycosylase F
MSFPYRVALTFANGSEELRDTVNQILKNYLQSDSYKKLVNKYIDSEQKLFHRKVDLLLMNGTQISKIDDLLKTESKKIGWDWRLLASLIMQESSFNAYATGQGAFGLMQFIPSTGALYKVYPNSTPEEQVIGGVQYLKYLDKMFASVPDINQRIKFILASYNGGPAHVLDAKRLARHFEEDHTDWDNVVSQYFLKLNDPEFYEIEVVKGGPYRGNFTVNYIKEIMERFEQFSASYPAE